MSRLADDYDNERPLVDNLIKFDNLTERISEEIDTLRDYVDVLNEYKAKMGTADDTKSMRARMNSEITETNDVIKRLLDLFQELEDLKFRKKKDIDNYNKMVRRLNNLFNEHNDKFTKVIKEIHSREKIFVQVRQASVVNMNNSFSEYSATVLSSGDQAVNNEDNRDSIVFRGSGHGARYDRYDNESMVQSNGSEVNNQYNPPGAFGTQETYNYRHDESAHQSVVEVMSDLDFYASIINERESNVRHVRELAAEMNKYAQVQAQRIGEQAEDLEYMVEYTTAAEANTVQANKELDQALKYQKKATKRNLCLTVLILVVCIVVAAIVFSLV